MPFASPDTVHPIRLANGSVHRGTVYLKAILDHPRIEVGAYTYMSRHEPLLESDEVVQCLAPYIHPFSPERLMIGKFCQIAHGVQFVTASANHRYDGLSSFPFAIFDGDFSPERPSLRKPIPAPDTIVGNDVWLGTGVTVLPGAKIGDGAIIGAGAVVGGRVPPYSKVAGNPARVVGQRLTESKAARMQAIAWWDWPIDEILTHEAVICGTDLAVLEAVAAARSV